MKIVFEEQFLGSFNTVLTYIARDKKSASIQFKKELKKKITALLDYPYMYRQSHYYEDEHYRDLTYKGYTVIYKITEDAIQILDIFKWVEK